MIELNLDKQGERFLHELIGENTIPMVKQPSVKMEFQDLVSLVRVWDTTENPTDEETIVLTDEDFDSVKSFIKVFIGVVCKATMDENYHILMNFYDELVSSATHESDKPVVEPLTSGYVAFDTGVTQDYPEPEITIYPSPIDEQVNDLFEEEELEDDSEDDFFLKEYKTKEEELEAVRAQARKEAAAREALKAKQPNFDRETVIMKDDIDLSLKDIPWINSY